MNPLPSSAQCIELVHRFYPVNLHEDDPRYEGSEEYQRLLRARLDALDKRDTWKQFLSRLREELPKCQVEDWTVLQSDSCWRVRVYLSSAVPVEGGLEFRSVVGLISLLAPVCAIYTSFHQRVGDLWRHPTLFYEHVPETRGVAETVERLLRFILGVVRLPNETLFTPVPDVQCFNVPLGKAQLIDCLFTDDRW
jgi:hypothetical protein